MMGGGGGAWRPSFKISAPSLRNLACTAEIAHIFLFQQLQSQISLIDKNGYNPFCGETHDLKTQYGTSSCVAISCFL